jgi:hypothetical protein
MSILAGLLGGISGAAKAGVENIDKNEKERIAKEAADLAYKRDMAKEAFRANNESKLADKRIAATAEENRLGRKHTTEENRLGREHTTNENRLGREHDVTMEGKRSQNNMANTILSSNLAQGRDNIDHQQQLERDRKAAEQSLANSITEFNLKVAAGNLTKDNKTAVESWTKELSSLIETDPTNPRIKMLQDNIDSALGIKVGGSTDTKPSLRDQLGLDDKDKQEPGSTSSAQPSASDRLSSVVEGNNNADMNQKMVANFEKDLELAARDVPGLIGVTPYSGGLLSKPTDEQGRLTYHIERLDKILRDDNATPEQKQRAEAMIAELEQGLRK